MVLCKSTSNISIHIKIIWQIWSKISFHNSQLWVKSTVFSLANYSKKKTATDIKWEKISRWSTLNLQNGNKGNIELETKIWSVYNGTTKICISHKLKWKRNWYTSAWLFDGWDGLHWYDIILTKNNRIITAIIEYNKISFGEPAHTRIQKNNWTCNLNRNTNEYDTQIKKAFTKVFKLLQINSFLQDQKDKVRARSLKI